MSPSGDRVLQGSWGAANLQSEKLVLIPAKQWHSRTDELVSKNDGNQAKS